MKKRSILPGFGPTLGFTLVYLALLVLIPLSALAVKSAQLSFSCWACWRAVATNRPLQSQCRTSRSSLSPPRT